MDTSVHSALTGVAVFAALELARRWARGVRGRWRAQKRARRYLRAEADAETLLESRGFRILDRQVHTEFDVQVGSAVTALTLRADLLVARRGHTYIAEVKSGDHAPCITNAATRRQLLEYLRVYDVDGVLLVHPDSSSVDEVVFDPPMATSSGLLWLAAAIALAGAGYLLVTV